jgi:hypothetical protein
VQQVEADTSRNQSEFLRRLFERELKSEGKSETTIDRYGLSIREWLRFSEAMNFPPMVTREHVTEFPAHRTNPHSGQREAGAAGPVAGRLTLSPWLRRAIA